MIRNGLSKIAAHRKDYSLIHTFGATQFDVKGLPENFSIYDGRPIPNQNNFDDRFSPVLRPLPMGCTAETTTFIAGLEDGALYPPDDFYFATPPGTDGEGRDIRASLSTAKSRGFKLPDGTIGAKKGDYFNCYGAGKIDDFDAVRIALWINQTEKRGVSVGSYFYPQFVGVEGIVSVPSFNTTEASLHDWLVTGWKTIEGKEYLEAITWQGQMLQYYSREIYNALMQQPYTGAFTLAKTPPTGAVAVGYQAIIDHLVYFIRNLFSLNVGDFPTRSDILYSTAKSCLGKDMVDDPGVDASVGCADSVNSVYKLAFGKELGGGASTAEMYKVLKKSYTQVDTAQPGDIVISPTGYSIKGAPHGHVGIVGYYGIMSNNSMTGLWSEYYTLPTWIAYYQTKLGFPVEFYRI